MKTTPPVPIGLTAGGVAGARFGSYFVLGAGAPPTQVGRRPRVASRTARSTQTWLGNWSGTCMCDTEGGHQSFRPGPLHLVCAVVAVLPSYLPNLPEPANTAVSSEHSGPDREMRRLMTRQPRVDSARGARTCASPVGEAALQWLEEMSVVPCILGPRSVSVALYTRKARCAASLGRQEGRARIEGMTRGIGLTRDRYWPG